MAPELLGALPENDAECPTSIIRFRRADGASEAARGGADHLCRHEKGAELTGGPDRRHLQFGRARRTCRQQRMSSFCRPPPPQPATVPDWCSHRRGMLRGSSELLQRSARSFVPVVEELVAAPAGLWTTDVDGYSADAISEVLGFAQALRRALHERASDILVTKVLLGTMGCVPAFDTNFKAGFGVTTFGVKSLPKVAQFYEDNAEAVEAHRVPTLDFSSGAPTERRYTRAKVIDMIFFIEGMR